MATEETVEKGRFDSGYGDHVISRIRSVSGAAETRWVKEILVEMVGTRPIVIDGAIPAGAFNVLVTSRVVEDVVTSGMDAEMDIGVTLDVYELDKLFGVNVSTAAGSVTTVEQYDPEFTTTTTINYFPEAGDIRIDSGNDFVSGRVRLVIFYSLLTPPRE